MKVRVGNMNMCDFLKLLFWQPSRLYLVHLTVTNRSIFFFFKDTLFKRSEDQNGMGEVLAD